jgi:hypothetical protein
MLIVKYKKFFFWWISILLIATGLFWAQHFGLIIKIWNDDHIKITSIISLIFLISNILLGYTAYKIADPEYVSQNKEKVLKKLNGFWFVSEQLMALGMLGTVIGLIYMLASNFVGQDLQNANYMQELLGSMWKSMGLALYANAVGLITSIILKVQVFIIGYDIDET